MKTRLIVDMSSLLWTCLLAGKDKEFGYTVEFEGKPVQINSAAYGYENLVNHFVSVLDRLNLTPRDMVLVVEGQNSKLLRTTIYDGYKGGSGKAPECYVEFQKLRDKIVPTLLDLGAIAATQNGIESDDVIAYLCHNLDGRKIVDSNDGDICALISDEYGNTTQNVSVWKQQKGELCESNPYGPFPSRLIAVYKALIGDTSDKLPGAKGFGDKAWLDLLVNFEVEGLEVMKVLMEKKQLHLLEEDVPALKALQKVLDQQDMVIKCYQCAKMYPDRVNTPRMPLEWTAGMVKAECSDERLRRWAQQTRIVHAGNFEQAFAWMKARYAESPILSFDIETSSNDRGDEWLEQAKKSEKKDGESSGGGVDVFGAKLTSFSVTFGQNMQYTFFFTVDHVEEHDVKNITRQQAKTVIESFPADKVNAIQNVAFELPVIYEDLGPLGQPVKDAVCND